jgi:hypothetical protein
MCDSLLIVHVNPFVSHSCLRAVDSQPLNVTRDSLLEMREAKGEQDSCRLSCRVAQHLIFLARQQAEIFVDACSWLIHV